MPGSDQLCGADRKLGPTGRIRSLRQSGVQRIASYDGAEAYEDRGQTVAPSEGDGGRAGRLAGKRGTGPPESAS
jgi:hypothetical protein